MLLGNLFAGRKKRLNDEVYFDDYDNKSVATLSAEETPDIDTECVDSAPYNNQIENLSIRVSMGYDGLITDVDNNLEVAVGYFRHDIIGTCFADWLVESDETEEFFEFLLREGYVYGYPLQIKRPDGNIVNVICAASIIRMFAPSVGVRHED